MNHRVNIQRSHVGLPYFVDFCFKKETTQDMHPRIVQWLTHTRPFLLNSTSRAHYYFAIKANKSSSLFVSTWQSAEGLRVSPQCDLTLTPVWPLFPQLHPGLDPLPLGSNKWELGSGEAEVGVHNGGSRGRRQTSNLKCLLNFFF